MDALTATDFDTTTLLANIALAGATLLTIALAKYGWRSIVGFFGLR